MKEFGIPGIGHFKQVIENNPFCRLFKNAQMQGIALVPR
jgi:hypothetical protein